MPKIVPSFNASSTEVAVLFDWNTEGDLALLPCWRRAGRKLASVGLRRTLGREQTLIMQARPRGLLCDDVGFRSGAGEDRHIGCKSILQAQTDCHRHTRTQCAQSYTEGAPAQRPSKRQGKKQAGGRRRPSKACQGVSSAIVQTWSFFPFERLICRRNFWPFDAVFEYQCLIHSTQSDRNPQGINQVCINCPNHRAEFCVIK